MKISVEHVEDQDIIASQDNAYAGKQKRPPGGTPTRLLSVALILVAMVAAILLLDAALPLRDLWFHDALLTQMGGWPVLPAMLIFPERPLLPHLPFQYATPTPGLMDGWFAISMLLVAFIAVFAVYLWALRRLPGSVSLRFIICSTLLIGCLYMLIPVVTSPDLFSYIAYARMGVLHNLNPLTTLPTAIRSDPVYNYVFWVDQPSAYGPTWAVITTTLQWMLAIFRNTYIMPMVIALRVTGLIMHLISTRLVWLISGQLQQLNGQPALATRKRIRATLAFAWNPLLLFEACVNAHVDATLLFFILLAIWVLARYSRPTFEVYLLAILLFACATAIKINVVLLVPALLVYLWKVRTWHFWRVLALAAIYAGTIALLYAPFWTHGQILALFRFNPATLRNINSLPEFTNRLYDALTFFNPLKLPHGAVSPSEHLTHTGSMALFALIYLGMCCFALRRGRVDTLPKLIGWMALSWLLYCFIGSPWFWPWYLVTFFGLFAILEALHPEAWVFGFFKLPLVTRLLLFSSLTLYCFFTWAMLNATLPGHPSFELSYTRGLWVWLLPLFALRVPVRQVTTRVRKLLLRQHFAA